MTDTMDLRFKVGDTVTCRDVQQILFRRDLVVVKSDPALVCVVTEGLSSAFFFDSPDPQFELKEPGIGRLTDSQLAMLKHVLRVWTVARMFADFPKLVEKAMESDEVDQTQTVPIAITANVPKQMASNWRRSTAILDLLRIIDPKIPEDTEKLLLCWVLFTVGRTPNAIILNQGG